MALDSGGSVAAEVVDAAAAEFVPDPEADAVRLAWLLDFPVVADGEVEEPRGGKLLSF